MYWFRRTQMFEKLRANFNNFRERSKELVNIATRQNMQDVIDQTLHTPNISPTDVIKKISSASCGNRLFDLALNRKTKAALARILSALPPDAIDKIKKDLGGQEINRKIKEACAPLFYARDEKIRKESEKIAQTAALQLVSTPDTFPDHRILKAIFTKYANNQEEDKTLQTIPKWYIDLTANDLKNLQSGSNEKLQLKAYHVPPEPEKQGEYVAICGEELDSFITQHHTLEIAPSDLLSRMIYLAEGKQDTQTKTKLSLNLPEEKRISFRRMELEDYVVRRARDLVD
jgi:hypothetical protein